MSDLYNPPPPECPACHVSAHVEVRGDIAYCGASVHGFNGHAWRITPEGATTVAQLIAILRDAPADHKVLMEADDGFPVHVGGVLVDRDTVRLVRPT